MDGNRKQKNWSCCNWIKKYHIISLISWCMHTDWQLEIVDCTLEEDTFNGDEENKCILPVLLGCKCS